MSIGYNNRWAYDSWDDSAANPTARDLNDLARSIKEWGWNDTPGTKTVNANRNTLTNLGPLSFGVNGGIADGSLSAPGLRFSNDQNTGLYRSAADTMVFVAGGTARASVDASGFGVYGPITALSKGHTIGTAGGSGGVSSPSPTSDANILLYDFGSGNWAGLGADGSGTMWFRTGLTGSGPAAMYILTDRTAIFNGSVVVSASAWNGSHLVLGNYHVWADGSGRLRIKSGPPSSDTDGTIVGLQS